MDDTRPASPDRNPGRDPPAPPDETKPSPRPTIPLDDFAVSSEPPDLPGYRILRELSMGGQGIVFEAVQLATQRKVAIKVLRSGPLAGERERAAFRREMVALGQLRHPHIVAIHDAGLTRGSEFFVMDYVSGYSLAEWVRHVFDRAPTDLTDPTGERTRSASVDGPALERFLRLFIKICRAAAAAHARGIIHRDLKTGNIRVDHQDEPHILDFGLAKFSASEGSDRDWTLTGEFMGSPAWASPEQAEAAPDRIDHRSDIYSLGVILYQSLAGRFPYPVTGDRLAVLDRVRRQPPAALPAVPRDLETITLKCLSKEPARRYASAADLADDLDRFLTGRPIDARRDTAYRLAMRARALTVARPVTRVAAIVLVTMLLANLLFAPLSHTYTNIDQRVTSLLSAIARPPTGGGSLAPVLVIAHRDEPPLTRLAELAGLSDFDPVKGGPVRRIVGRLLAKLAQAGPRAVAWDARPDGESPGDVELVAGIQALEKVGIDFVVGHYLWQLNEQGIPPTSPLVLSETDTRWGGLAGSMPPDSPWQLELFIRTPGQPARLSFALAALAAYRHPRHEVDLLPVAATPRAELRYYPPTPQARRARAATIATDTIRYTGDSAPLDGAEIDVPDDAQIGVLTLQMPSAGVLDASTLDIAEALRMDDYLLRSLVAEKLVMIADLRKQGGFEPDFYPCQGHDQPVAGVYAHAVALRTLLAQNPLTAPGLFPTEMLYLSAALWGALQGGGRRTLRRRLAWLMAGVFVLACFGILTAFAAGMLVDPFVPGVSMLTAFSLAVGLRRFLDSPAAAAGRPTLASLPPQ